MFNNLRLKRVTYNLGKTKETDQDITCAVDNEKLSNRLTKHDNHLLLKSKNDPKEITYVISDMIFPAHTKITTDDNIIFINCTFNNELLIESANKVIFTNNKYYIPDNLFIFNDRFLVINNTNTVSFINENFVNSSDLSHKYDMKLEAKNIIIDSTNMYTNNEGHIYYNCKNLCIKKDSEISLRTAYIKSDNIAIDYSSTIDVKNKIQVETRQAIGLSNISCNTTIINGMRVQDIEKIEEKKQNKIKKKESNI